MRGAKCRTHGYALQIPRTTENEMRREAQNHIAGMKR